MQCRICLDESNPELMISPCKCRGSVKWVHKECLDLWFKNNHKNCKKCNSCNFYYHFENPYGLINNIFFELINLIISNIFYYSYYFMIFYLLLFIFTIIITEKPINYSINLFKEIGNNIMYFHLIIQIISIFYIENINYFFNLNYLGLFSFLIIQYFFFYVFYYNPFQFIFLHFFIASWYQTILIHFNTIKIFRKNVVIKSLNDDEIKYL